jgi:hypothetical protein
MDFDKLLGKKYVSKPIEKEETDERRETTASVPAQTDRPGPRPTQGSKKQTGHKPKNPSS